MTQLQMYWVAGILEGEGTFLKPHPSTPNQPSLGLSMCDKDTVERVASIFRVSFFAIKPRKSHWSTSYVMRIRGKQAMAVMRAIRPLMSGRRQAQIDAALNSYDPTKREKANRVRRILSDAQIKRSIRRIAKGESMRSVARSLSVNHESLRKRIIKMAGPRRIELRSGDKQSPILPLNDNPAGAPGRTRTCGVLGVGQAF